MWVHDEFSRERPLTKRGWRCSVWIMWVTVCSFISVSEAQKHWRLREVESVLLWRSNKQSNGLKAPVFTDVYRASKTSAASPLTIESPRFPVDELHLSVTIEKRCICISEYLLPLQVWNHWLFMKPFVSFSDCEKVQRCWNRLVLAGRRDFWKNG